MKAFRMDTAPPGDDELLRNKLMGWDDNADAQIRWNAPHLLGGGIAVAED